MTQERDGTATVIKQDEDRVRVQYDAEILDVAMEGFPLAFRLRPGEKVILVDEPSGPVARPLVRAITSQVPHEALQRRGELEVAGRRLAMQAATVVEEPEHQRAEATPKEQVLWIVEPGDAQGPSQVVAAGRRPRG